MSIAKVEMRSTQGGRMSRRTIVLPSWAIKAILRHYASRGKEAIPELCRRYGVGEYYIRQLAMVHGVKAPVRRGGRRGTASDPRWQRAIERGPVIA